MPHKTGDARGRRSWRSSFLGDPGSKFLCGKLGKAGRKKSKEKKSDGIQAAELARRDQVTATNSWPNFPSREGSKVDNQVAAPTETSTPNLHRATIAQQRVRMEGWQQRRLGSMGTIWKRRNKEEERTNARKGLTLTGLLMEGLERRKMSRKEQIVGCMSPTRARSGKSRMRGFCSMHEPIFDWICYEFDPGTGPAFLEKRRIQA